MSDIENKKTTPKQKVLIVLITVVLLLLVAQVISGGGEADPELPEDRDTCLTAGYIWSQSAQQCYNSSMAASPEDVEAVSLRVGESATANEVEITLREIVTDDRCPLNTECMQAGSVVAGVTLIRDGVRVEPNLDTSKTAYSFDGRDVQLMFVEPYPENSASIATDDYELTFWVTNLTS